MQKQQKTNILEFFETYKMYKIHLRPATIESYLEKINLFIKDTGVNNIEDITEQVVLQWRFDIINRSSIGNWNTYHNNLSPIINLAVKLKIIDRNIFDEFKPQKRPKPNYEDKVLNTEKFKQIIRYLESSNNIDAWFWIQVTKFLYHTGVRRVQLTGIYWKDIKADKIKLSKEYAKSGKDNWIPINGNIYKIINTIKLKLPHGNNLNTQVFNVTKINSRYAGNMTTPKQVTYFYIRLSKKLGFKIHPHLFRHTMATNIAQKGGDLVALKEILGHAEITTTMNYLHTNLEQKSKVLRLL
jgi:integrase